MTEGLLQEIPLVEVIQLIAINAATGNLELVPLFPATQPRERMPIGHLAFREGKPHAAFLADRAREHAVENMFLWEAGFFTFTPCEPQDLPPPNLTVDTPTLIFRGIKRQEDWARVRELVPTIHMALVAATPTGTVLPPESVTPEGQILSLCDGQTTLATIADRIGMGRLRCRETAARLLREGFAAHMPPSTGEKLARAIAQSAYPMLGVAAELFCDDALRGAGFPPERLPQITTLSVAAVAQVVQAMEAGVAQVLGPERGAQLAEKLRLDLGIAAYPAKAHNQT